MKKLYLFFALAPYLSNAQGEFITEVNVADGTYTKTGPKIADITYVFPEDTAFDENTGTFFFRSSLPTENLYGINTNDGTVVNSPLVSNIIHFEYDNTAGTMYAIKIGGGSKRLVTFDRTTGTTLNVGSTFSDGGYMQGDCVAIDEASHVYFLVYANTIYAISTVDGDIISAVPLVFPSGTVLVNISFDQSTGNLYGILSKNSVGKVYLAEIDSSTGVITQMGTGSTFGIGNGSGTIDEMNQHYIYTYNNNGIFSMTSFSLADGSYVSNHVFNPLDPNDNMHSIEFDNSQQKLFAMHWDSQLPLGTGTVQDIGFKGVYPNPFSDYGFLDVPADSKSYDLLIYDISGKMVMSKKSIKTDKIRIEKSNLAGGVYSYNLICDAVTVHTGKFMIK